MHSISTAMPPGSAPAWIVVRAGQGAEKKRRVNLVHSGEIVDVAKIDVALNDVIE